MVVYQCIQAVDLYGLALEGIYRQSGSMAHIQKLKNMFDTGWSTPFIGEDRLANAGQNRPTPLSTLETPKISITMSTA